MEQITDTLNQKMNIGSGSKENTDQPPDRSLIKPVFRAPLDPEPYKNRDKTSKPKLKYKEEKKLKKLKKSAEYRASYKEKERVNKQNYSDNRPNYSDNRPNYSDNRPNYSDIRINKFDLCDDLILILKDKIANKQIQLTSFEEKTVMKFFSTFEKKENEKNTTPQLQNCFTGDKCIVWYCKFEHSANRKKECKCTNPECINLHQNQALCKNPNHPSDCKMAHNVDELNK